jgi:hypothetical protein
MIEEFCQEKIFTYLITMALIPSGLPRAFIPAKRLCHNCEKLRQGRHTGESRYPELFKNTGFRVALRLHGMTN